MAMAFINPTAPCLTQLSTFVTQSLYSSTQGHPVAEKAPNALRFGILSTAAINPAALIRPAETHPDVLLYGIASRSYENARAYAKKYGFSKAYASYQELLEDPDIDAVYISLPNGMHCEWATKALDAGKHVLLEKPFTSNADEARALAAAADRTRNVCEEAFHWQFHPAAHVVDALVSSGRYGRIISTHACMTTPRDTIPKSNIRWQYELAGGALMDMAYVLSATRYFLHAPKLESVTQAKAVPSARDRRVDSAMQATLVFSSPLSPAEPVTSSIYADMDRGHAFFVVPRLWEHPAITIECERASVYFYNFTMPHLYHYIAITDRHTGHTSYQKHYNLGPKWGVRSRGEPWWSTYRYQLEAFVDKLRGREPPHWISARDSIQQMEAVDAVYEASGLGKRGGGHGAANQPEGQDEARAQNGSKAAAENQADGAGK